MERVYVFGSLSIIIRMREEEVLFKGWDWNGDEEDSFVFKSIRRWR